MVDVLITGQVLTQKHQYQYPSSLDSWMVAPPFLLAGVTTIESTVRSVSSSPAKQNRAHTILALILPVLPDAIHVGHRPWHEILPILPIRPHLELPGKSHTRPGQHWDQHFNSIISWILIMSYSCSLQLGLIVYPPRSIPEKI